MPHKRSGNESPPSSAPLPLYRVLEEEYERLHGGPVPAVGQVSGSKQRLENVIGEIHARAHTALCLSGGGIRSATFALGVLQGLARRGLLDKFDYLSTVSGGGYVGGWLSAWIHRHKEGVAGVMRELQTSPDMKLAPEPDPVQHLRSYSNYLTPRLGFFSADTWTLAAIILRNLILNWLVLVPMMLLVLALPRLAVAVMRFDPAASGAPWLVWTTLALGFVCGVVAIAYVGAKRPSSTLDDNTVAGFLGKCLLPLLASAVLLTTFWAWMRHANVGVDEQLISAAGLWSGFLVHPMIPFVAFGAAFYFVGWLIYSAQLGHFSFWKPGWRGTLNWFRVLELVFVLVSGAAGGLFLWLVATKAFPTPDAGERALYYVTFAAPIYLTLFLLAATLFAGLSSEYTADEDREWWARFSAWVLIAIVAWIAVSFLVLLGPHLLQTAWAKYVVPAGGFVGLLTAYLARSAKSPANEKQEGRGGWRAKLMRFALPLGALLFIALTVVLLSFGTNYLLGIITLVAGGPVKVENPPEARSWYLLDAKSLPGGTLSGLDNSAVILDAPFWLLVAFVVAVSALALLFSYFINTNKFSHHAMYRNRLIRAYLGASNRYRSANRFTRFDPDDNVPMHELRPEAFHPGSFRDLGRFVLNLQQGTNSFYQWFIEKMSDRTKKFVHDYDPRLSPQKILRSSLIDDLNERFIYKPDPLFDDFHGFDYEMLTPKAKKLHDRHGPKPARTDQIALFNRRVVESAFPEDLFECPDPPHRPLHVVNMALNLVRGTNLAWQDRKAESFTASPLHCGSCQIPDFEDDEDGQRRPVYGSYRRSRDYGGRDTKGISLGTAVAISGAAVSPNMGYYSSPLVTFLMTLFNVRLGWWLGNPGKAGSPFYYQMANPRFSGYPIIAEALGLTDDENSYIYLSDGGHFENLGLYEMVLRRCQLIVVSDASDDFDFKFDNLGNAIRKIRIDFGIPVEFDAMHIYPRGKNRRGAFCAVGRVRYSRVDKLKDRNVEGKLKPAPDGTIVYVKPVFYGDEPRDIYHYAQVNERFPHESTADQWFSEEQFESYRSLGVYIVSKILGEKDSELGVVSRAAPFARPPNLEQFKERAARHVREFNDQADRGDGSAPAEGAHAALLALAKESLKEFTFE